MGSVSSYNVQWWAHDMILISGAWSSDGDFLPPCSASSPHGDSGLDKMDHFIIKHLPHQQIYLIKTILNLADKGGDLKYICL